MSCNCPLFLLLSSHAGLDEDDLLSSAIVDRKLTVRVIPNGVGHFMHEDQPHNIAIELMSFFCQLML